MDCDIDDTGTLIIASNRDTSLIIVFERDQENRGIWAISYHNKTLRDVELISHKEFCLKSRRLLQNGWVNLNSNLQGLNVANR